VLYKAQRQHQLVTTGVYTYVGFIAIMFGFLLQWPTILTLVMFPLLVWMYVRLAHAEEGEALREFGRTYEHYAAVTARWHPPWARPPSPHGASGCASGTLPVARCCVSARC
jgi:protein-S-isoprenylcysteine O-methyltransferase Ste14